MKPLPGALVAFAAAFAATGAIAQPMPPDAAFVRQHAHPLPALGRLPDTIAPDIAPYRVLLLGELHGTREAPRLALELARLVQHNGRGAWLGLEIPVTEQAALDRFRASGDVTILKQMPFFRRPVELQDGRSSAAMAQLLQLAQKVPDLPLYCVDPGVATSPQDRDNGMAREVARHLAAYPGAVGVILTGNAHARVSAGAAWDASYHPMGYVLSHGVLPPAQVLAIELQWQQGTTWGTLSKPGEPTVTGIHPTPTVTSIYASAGLWGAMFLKLPAVSDGYGAVLFWRTLSASPPFVPVTSSPVSTPAPSPRPTPPVATPRARPTGAHP